MDKFRRNLMLRESKSRLRSADLLRTANDDADSAYLLRLLAFELLLKVILEESLGVAPPRHHRYGELFVTLPDEVKVNLISLAGERIGPSALSSDAIKVLDELGSNFIDLRYPYDKYVGMSEAQYRQAGMDWISAGSAPENAVFRYHPEELLGLTYAAQKITAGS
jgi:HEPN domain-containing protein